MKHRECEIKLVEEEEEEEESKRGDTNKKLTKNR